ncbi:MAG: MBL fold metallo-hydrolase [Bacteroidota bacterium]
MEDIEMMIATHAHHDHGGNGRYFQEQYGIKVIGGKGDLALFEAGINDELCPTNAFTRFLKSIMDDHFEPYQPDILVDSIYNLSEFGIDGTIYPMAGHTEGSLAIKIADQLFVGDVIRGKPLSNNKPARHYFLCDLDKNVENIKYLLSLEECEQWYTGHFGELKRADVVDFVGKLEE